MKRLTSVLVLLMLAVYLDSRAVEQPNLPSVFDMVMFAGADYALTIQIKDSAGATYDMTGSTYAAQFRSTTAPAGVLYANFSTVQRSPFTTYSGTQTTYLPVLDIKLSNAQTKSLSGKSGVWDLKQTAINGLVSYILTGKVGVRPTVTQ